VQLTKFCPRCGTETDRLHGDSQKLCASCYPDKNELLEIPGVVRIEVCSICGRMRKGGEWMEEYTVQEQLSTRFAEFNEDEIEMRLQFWEDDEDMFVRVHASKGEIRDSYDTEVRFDNTQCETCSKFSGGFYKVKIQLRGDADLEKVSDEVADKAAEITNRDRSKFMSNIEKNDHGFDIYLSTESMAKEILEKVKALHDPEVKRSYELIGERDGEEVYRNVISVRL